LLGGIVLSCGKGNKEEKSMEEYKKGTFGYDLQYLTRKDDGLIVLTGEEGKQQIIVSPKYQSKVFTSTATGLSGNSLGFINYKFFDAGVIDKHMNGYGGENRFWLGPEGGMYSVYFESGKEQIFDNWHTPKPIDIEPWDIVSSDRQNVVLKKEIQVENYLGTVMKLNVDRKIGLIETNEACRMLGLENNSGFDLVAYTTDNVITNLNDFEWTKETGTICIWVLDMFNPAPRAVTIVPFNEGGETELGKIVTSDYFGEIPADRLKMKGNNIFLKTDGLYRSKLGLNGKRTNGIAANYDPDSKRLTITTFEVDKDAVYLNQEWNPEKNPLIGDAMNAYNDGPLADGSMMGPFLELESVSPAAFLKPRDSLGHKHTVYHFIGEEADLSPITKKLLGVSIDEIHKWRHESAYSQSHLGS
jgi:hypothetical protein